MSIVLFAELQDETPYTVTHKDAALSLRAAVEKACGSPAGYSLKAWANEFRTLAKGIPDERWLPVLEAYCKVIGKEFIPQAFSAKTFRMKFLQIEQAVQRVNKETPIGPISEQAQQVVRILNKLNWGNGKLDELPAAVQITLDQRAKTVKLLKQIGMYSDLYPLAERLLQWLSNPHDFAVAWFRDKQKNLSQWSQWSGRFVKQVYLHNGTQLSNRIFAIARSYGNTKLADQLALRLGI